MDTNIIGRHCCLWCTVTSAQLKIPLCDWKKLPEKHRPKPRTLSSLKEDHGKFIAAGDDLSKAKEHNNVIRPAIFDIPLEQVIGYLLFSNLNEDTKFGVLSWPPYFIGHV